MDSSSDVGVYVKLALDSDDRPRIAYYHHVSTDLMYASWDFGSSQVELVDGKTTQVGKYNDLVLDADGHPHISYYDSLDKTIGQRFILRLSILQPVYYSKEVEEIELMSVQGWVNHTSYANTVGLRKAVLGQALIPSSIDERGG